MKRLRHVDVITRRSNIFDETCAIVRRLARDVIYTFALISNPLSARSSIPNISEMDRGRLTSTLMLNIFFSPSSFLINIDPFFSFLPRKITCRRWRRLFQHRGWRTRDETLERGCVNRAFAYDWPVLSTTRRLLKRPMVCHRPFLSRKTGSRLGRPLITDTRQTAIRRDLSLSGYSGRVIIKLTWCTNRHEILFQLSSARRCMYFFQT